MLPFGALLDEGSSGLQQAKRKVLRGYLKEPDGGQFWRQRFEDFQASAEFV